MSLDAYLLEKMRKVYTPLMHSTKYGK